MSAPEADLRSPNPEAARTRATIVLAAERCFSERGFDRTRLEDVAAQVGIRHARIVYDFLDEQELYDSVLGDRCPRLYEALRGPLAGGASPLTQVEAGYPLVFGHSEWSQA